MAGVVTGLTGSVIAPLAEMCLFTGRFARLALRECESFCGCILNPILSFGCVLFSLCTSVSDLRDYDR